MESTEECVTCRQVKILPYVKGDGRQCQNCRKKELRRARGLLPRGPKPDASKPYSRHNPASSKMSKGIRTNVRRELGGQCRAGHVLDEDNGFYDEKGYLRCRACQSNAKRKALGLPLVTRVVRRSQETCPKGHQYPEGPRPKYCIQCRRYRDIEQKYGLSPEDFTLLLEEQSHCCAVCEMPFSELSNKSTHVDHDHDTGVIRGILCSNCNTGLGLLGDTIEAIQRALAYVSGETMVAP